MFSYGSQTYFGDPWPVDFKAMMHYFFLGLTGLGLIAVILLATWSCTKKDRAACPVTTNGSGKRPDETDPEKGVYVIGREMAKAVEAEQRWKQQGTRESPLPKRGYDSWHGDLSLVDPAPNSLDDALREIAGRYATSDPQLLGYNIPDRGEDDLVGRSLQLF